jgi:hypothetical protein
LWLEPECRWIVCHAKRSVAARTAESKGRARLGCTHEFKDGNSMPEASGMKCKAGRRARWQKGETDIDRLRSVETVSAQRSAGRVLARQLDDFLEF